MEILGYLLLTFLSSPRFYLDTVLLRASCFAVSLLLQLYGLGLITCSSSQLITELWIFFFLHLTSDQPSRKASACTVQHSTERRRQTSMIWAEFELTILMPNLSRPTPQTVQPCDRMFSCFFRNFRWCRTLFFTCICFRPHAASVPSFVPFFVCKFFQLCFVLLYTGCP